MDKKLAYAGVTIALILVVAYVAYTAYSTPSLTSATNRVALQLTDPPQVPGGTQHLIIGYSSLSVHLSNANNASGWLPASGSGSIDLLQIVNLTQTIGTVQLPANASIELVRFNVTSAAITINGTAYNLTVPSGTVTAHVTGRTSVNASSSILLDLSPTVVTIVTNSTDIFVLVPSVRAVVVPRGTNSTSIRLGSRGNLTARHREALERSELNLTITRASLSVSGNVTHLSVNVTDNSNRSVTLRYVGWRGNQSVALDISSLQAKINGYIANATSHLQDICSRLNQTSAEFPENVTPEEANAIRSIEQRVGNSSMAQNAGYNIGPSASSPGIPEFFNRSICKQGGVANLTARLQAKAENYTSRLQRVQGSMRYMVFTVASNGSLAVPFSVGEEEQQDTVGYVLQAGQSVTLSFNGTISINNGLMTIAPTSGNEYEIAVQGSEDAFAKTNVTAT